MPIVRSLPSRMKRTGEIWSRFTFRDGSSGCALLLRLKSSDISRAESMEIILNDLIITLHFSDGLLVEATVEEVEQEEDRAHVTRVPL